LFLLLPPRLKMPITQQWGQDGSVDIGTKLQAGCQDFPLLHHLLTVASMYLHVKGVKLMAHKAD